MMSDTIEQPKNDSSLSKSFQKLEISKPLNKKKDEYLNTIRSAKRKLYLQNKRLSAFSINSLSSQLDNVQLQEDKLGQGLSLTDFILDCQSQTYTLEQMSELVSSLYSTNPYRQFFGVIGIRNLLAAGENPPIQPLIDADVVPRLVEFLSREDDHDLQLNATWALSNLSSGTTAQTEEVVNNGAIPALIKLLGSHSIDVQLQAIWTLGNIAGDSTKFRDLIIEGGVVNPLIKIMEEAISNGRTQIIKYGTWALSNLCRGKPLPLFEEIKETIPVFVKIIMSQEDVDALTDALVCMCNLCDAGPERMQWVLDTGVLSMIVKYMDHVSTTISYYSIRMIGTLFTGNDEQVDSLLAIPGIIEKLFHALRSPKKNIRREVAWTISNIMAGPPKHIDYVIGHVDQLFETAMNDVLLVRKEIALALSNVLLNATQDQLKVLFEKKILEYYGRLVEEEELQEIGLTAIREILDMEETRDLGGQPSGFCWSFFKEKDIILVIEKLQMHANIQISQLASDILLHDPNPIEADEKDRTEGVNFKF